MRLLLLIVLLLNLSYSQSTLKFIQVRGINQEYQLGELLKKTYGDFLDSYKPSQIHTYTGVDNRTVTSAQALFAGLLPPKSNEIWNSKLAWQPVSMHTDETIDWVSTGIEKVCPVYEKQFFNSPEFNAIPHQLDQDVLNFMRNATGGLPNDDVVDINRFIDSLVCRAALNDSRLPYPQWAIPVLDKISPFHYKIHDLILNLQNKTVGGYHIEKILAYIEDHLQRPHNKMNKAVFLAAHDTNLMAIGKALNIQAIPKPNFGSHLVVELHLINGVHQLKFFYRNGVGNPVVEVNPTHCGNPCTLDSLQALSQGYRTSDAEFLKICRNVGPIEGANGFLTGILVALTAIFLLTTVIFGCTSYSYKKQLREITDPERTHLLR